MSPLVEEKDQELLEFRRSKLGYIQRLSAPAPHDGDEDDGGYKSCDDNDDGPLLNENDDYVRF